MAMTAWPVNLLQKVEEHESEVQLWSKIGNVPLLLAVCCHSLAMCEWWAVCKVSSGCNLRGSRSRTGSGCSPLWPAFWLVEVPLSLSLFYCMLCRLYINICKLKSQVVKHPLCVVWFGSKLFADVTSDSARLVCIASSSSSSSFFQFSLALPFQIYLLSLTLVHTKSARR
jgi:hypothetical protein